MLRIWPILFILIASFNHAFGACDLESIPEKIRQLRLEVACSEGPVHFCREALTPDFSKETESIKECVAPVIAVTSPISTSTSLLISQLDQKIIHPSYHLVNSVEEFYEHTVLHRSRVRELGLSLYKTHPKLFEGLTYYQVSMALEAHDKAKISASALSPHGKPFYRTLYEEGFGRKIDQNIVDALNANDKKFMEEAHWKSGIKTPEQIAQMERLEKIADMVDRGMSNVTPEEFGRLVSKASEFLKDPIDQRLALELESKYSEITKDFKYKVLTPEQIKLRSFHMRVNENFAQKMRGGDYSKVSAKVMAHSLLKNGKNSFGKLLGVLASEGAKKAFILLDGVLLYFSDMDRIGCSELGYHDWVKDPECKPAMGLTPKMVQFLDEDWATQRSHLENENHTCQVVNETYQKSITAPKVLGCSDQEVKLELLSGDQLLVKLDSNKKLSEVHLNGVGEQIRTQNLGKADVIKVGTNGLVSEACYSKKMKGVVSSRCLNEKDPAIQGASELLSGLNYQIQKGIACCSNGSQKLNLICPR